MAVYPGGFSATSSVTLEMKWKTFRRNNARNLCFWHAVEPPNGVKYERNEWTEMVKTVNETALTTCFLTTDEIWFITLTVCTAVAQLHFGSYNYDTTMQWYNACVHIPGYFFRIAPARTIIAMHNPVGHESHQSVVVLRLSAHLLFFGEQTKRLTRMCIAGWPAGRRGIVCKSPTPVRVHCLDDDDVCGLTWTYVWVSGACVHIAAVIAGFVNAPWMRVTVRGE